VETHGRVSCEVRTTSAYRNVKLSLTGRGSMYVCSLLGANIIHTSKSKGITVTGRGSTVVIPVRYERLHIEK
jgi:hypothetical protein